MWRCRAAAAVRAIFVDFDARFEAGSLDEAYLDVTDYCKQHGLTGRHKVTYLVQATFRQVRMNTMRWMSTSVCYLTCSPKEMSERPHSFKIL